MQHLYEESQNNCDALQEKLLQTCKRPRRLTTTATPAEDFGVAWQNLMSCLDPTTQNELAIRGIGLKTTHPDKTGHLRRKDQAMLRHIHQKMVELKQGG